MKNEELCKAWGKWQKEHYRKAVSFFAAQPGIRKNHGAIWHARRAVTVTGTDISVIAGSNPYKYPLDLYEYKSLINYQDGKNSLALEIGNALEPVVINRTLLKLNAEKAPSHFPRFARNADCPWSRSQIDELIFVPNLGYCILECKTSEFGSGFGTPSGFDKQDGLVNFSDEVPMYYFLQAHKELSDARKDKMLKYLDIKYVIVSCMQGFKEPDVYVMQYNEEICKEIERIGTKFMFDYIIPGKVPPLTYKQQSVNFSKRPHKPGKYLHNDGSQESRALIADLMKKVAEYRNIKANIKALEIKAESLKEILTTCIGENEGLCNLNGDVIATWKATSKFNEELFIKEHQDLAEKYTKFDAAALKKANAKIYAEYSMPAYRTFKVKD